MRPSGGVGQQRPGAPRFTPPPMRPQMGRRPDGEQRRDVRSQSMASVAPPPITRTVTFVEGMTVKDLADKLDQRVKDVLKKLLDKRLMMTINSTVDTDTASMIAREFGAEVQLRTFEQDMLEVEAEEVKPEDTIPRAPVVTVMGHVDHGKTTLLDAIRTARVAEREAGGITQHIGAYHVTTANNRDIVFLDTPGHEAFTLMRARGAKVTDVVVLVVAADDGVMPQTREAIDHAKAANVPIIVAINKIDKPGTDPERVKRELSDLNLVPEDWGGQTVMVPVSAKKKTGLDTLLEMILLVSDIGEYKANPKRNASGTVLESKLDRGRGPVATILVQDGTLRVGDTFIAGPIVGRVRALIDDRGKPIKLAPPSTPVEVLGLTGLPQPGDAFQALADAAKARQIATYRQGMAKEKALGAKGSRLTLESLQQQIAEGGMKDLADRHQVGRAGLGGSAGRHACEVERRSRAHQDHPFGRGRHQRIRRAARVGLERRHHRVQCPSGPQRRTTGRARRGRHPPSHRHLQRHRRDEEGDDRPARADAQGSTARSGRSAQHLQGAQSGHDCRLLRASTGASHAAAKPRRGWSATVLSCTKGRSALCGASRMT